MKRGLLYTSLIAMIGVINFANVAGTHSQYPQYPQCGGHGAQQPQYPQQQQPRPYVSQYPQDNWHGAQQTYPPQQPQYPQQQQLQYRVYDAQQTYQQQQLELQQKLERLEADLERIRSQANDHMRQADDFKRQANESSKQYEAACKTVDETQAKLLEAQRRIEEQSKDLKDKCEEIKKQKEEHLTITQKCDEIEKQKEATAAKLKEVEEQLKEATLKLERAADEEKRRKDQAEAEGRLETNPIYGGGERIFNYKECTLEGKMERSACLIATLKEHLPDLPISDYLFCDIHRIADKYCKFNNLYVPDMDRVLIPAIAPSAHETAEAECCLSEYYVQDYAAAECRSSEYVLSDSSSSSSSSVPEVNRSEPSSNRSPVRLEWFPGLKITNSRGDTIQSDHVDVRALCNMLNTTSSAELRFQLKGEQVSGLNVRMLTLNMLCKGLYFIEHDIVVKFGSDFVTNDQWYEEPVAEDYQMDSVKFAFTDELTKGDNGHLIAKGFSLNTSGKLGRSTSDSQVTILGIHLLEFYRSEVINAIMNLMDFSVME